jgi:hypothetical protein
LLVALFMSADALALTPLVIVAVTVAYVTSARLKPPAAPQPKVPEPARRAVASPPGPRSA